MKNNISQIMGVINMTPESRYGGGQTRLCDEVLFCVENMIRFGAAIIDVGGESTRPEGTKKVSLQEECDRVVPVVEAIKQNFQTRVSVDTRHTEVMEAVLSAGADIINDINALQAPGAIELIARKKAKVFLMHMQGTPQTMQLNPHYENIVEEIKNFFIQRTEVCMAAGIARENIGIDPGFGFGKNLTHNLTLLKNLKSFESLGFPILVGLSRKNMIGDALGLPVEERLPASLALAVLAANAGANIIRTHDVKETFEAVRMGEFIKC